MQTNYKNIILVWRLANSVFSMGGLIDELDIIHHEELHDFVSSYYDFMKACNKLFDFAKNLPF